MRDLPKRFVLLPDDKGALEVNVSAQCVGYVWTDEEKWMAKSYSGEMLDTGSGNSVFEAVAAVFRAHQVSYS